ncbi:hypothetical protein VEE76_38740 [Escherichia coli]|uniref:hypothetical protein n=1 Tax=Escherichia coli TaxID=562 RepID=UPI002B2958C9|nr:hypothetical protein VEE76_38740 [Escherichia coli]
MNKIKYIVALAFCVYFNTASVDVYAANIDTNIVTVKSIKADWARESESNIYYYLFNGLPEGEKCGKSDWARSGDNNINRILHEAYLSDNGVRLGISKDACTIKTVLIDKYY